jgi:hypothetical protein
LKKILKGEINIVYSSPEAMLANKQWREMQGRIQTDANDANASVKIEKSCCLK